MEANKRLLEEKEMIETAIKDWLSEDFLNRYSTEGIFTYGSNDWEFKLKFLEFKGEVKEWEEKALKFYKLNKDILDRHTPRVRLAVYCYLFGPFNQRECAYRLSETTEVGIRSVLRQLEREGRIEKKERTYYKTYYRVL